jgi:DNA sulfur modification protein DndD
MTEAYRDMAHKKVVERIAIEPDCNVLLLSKSGKDVRNFDPSAGENQIFAFALISAIAQAAEVRFPIVIDTPLARLDKDHRLNVLRHFTDRAGEQIILLSQNEEVVGDKLDSIRTKTYLVETEQLSMDVGRSSAYEYRYFEPIY